MGGRFDESRLIAFLHGLVRRNRDGCGRRTDAQTLDYRRC
ncbi:hypothetical protein D555_0778 [Bordetella holmesii 35009]|nr:hypothetical protein D555_0778 [Bordetella holmesii 35009]